VPTIVNNRSSLATDPLRNFRYLVNFYPLNDSTAAGGINNAAMKNLAKPPVSFGFTSVSGLSITTDSIPYREGGYNTTVHQIPGQTTFAPVTFQRGVILGTSQNWDWMRQLFATVQGGGSKLSIGQNFRCDVEIQILAHPVPSATVSSDSASTAASSDVIHQNFYVYNCWPTSVSYSDLNAGDNALFVEQMTLVHEGFDVSWGYNSDITKSAPSATSTGGPNSLAYPSA